MHTKCDAQSRMASAIAELLSTYTYVCCIFDEIVVTGRKAPFYYLIADKQGKLLAGLVLRQHKAAS